MRIKTKKALQLGEGAKRDGSIGDRIVTKPGQEYSVSDGFKKDPFFQLAYKAGDIEVLAEPVEILVGEPVAQLETPEAPGTEPSETSESETSEAETAEPETATIEPEEASAEPEAEPEETSEEAPAEPEAEPEETSEEAPAEPETATEETPAKTARKKTSK